MLLFITPLLMNLQDSMSLELQGSRNGVRDSSYAFRLRRRGPPGVALMPFIYG